MGSPSTARSFWHLFDAPGRSSSPPATSPARSALHLALGCGDGRPARGPHRYCRDRVSRSPMRASAPPVASGRQWANEASRTAGSRRETHWDATGRPAFETAVAWDQCEESTSPPTVDLRQRLPFQGAAAGRAGAISSSPRTCAATLSASCGSTGSLRPYGRDSKAGVSVRDEAPEGNRSARGMNTKSGRST
jgi:hypothetical protein